MRWGEDELPILVTSLRGDVGLAGDNESVLYFLLDFVFLLVE